MTTAIDVQMVPVDAITVLNPRARNRRVFHELITSIAHLGLKKPITVSRRGTEPEYDLVCGQGRLEAFLALGQSEIPAIVIEASQEDCYVMSLVENLARRHPRSLELIREIGILKDRGYTTPEIAAKIDFCPIISRRSAIFWNMVRNGSSSRSSAASCRPISQWRLPALPT